MPRSTTFKAAIGSKWETMTADHGLAIGVTRGLCVECNNPFQVYRASEDAGRAAHVHHLKRQRSNPKCSLSDVFR